MGMNNSIVSYIKKDKIADCLKWLNNNSEDDKTFLRLIINNEELKIYGSGFKLNDYRSSYLNKNEVVKDFDILYFNTCLIVDIDPPLIAALANGPLKYHGYEYVENFKETFMQRYYNYESKVIWLKDQEVFVLAFSAVTTDMSIAMEESLAVKQWMIELSMNLDAILTHLDQDYDGRRMLYHRGNEIETIISEKIDEAPFDLPASFLDDYLSLALAYDRIK